MGKHAVLAVVGLAVGLVVGVILGMALGGEGANPAARNMVADEQPPACNGKPLEKTNAPELENGDGGEVTPRETPPRELDSLAAIIAKAEIPPVPSGDGVITGNVLTEAGGPLAGVTITAYSDYPDDKGYSGKTAQERIAARIRYECWIDAAKRTATTSADGTYKLEGLAVGIEHYVAAQAAGWEFDLKDSRRYKYTAGDSCDFVAKAVVELEVRVLMPDGSPALSGDVDCERKLGSSTTSTGANIQSGGCTITLGVGKWSVSAKAGKYDDLSAQAVEVTLEGGVKPEPLVLQLKSSPGIFGKVKTPSSVSNLRFSVQLQANPPADPPAASVDEYRRGEYGSQRGSSFQFTGLAPGRYRLILIAENRVQDWEDVTVSDALVEVTLELPEPDRANYIVVRAYDPEGKPLGDLDLRLSYESNNSSRGGGGGEIKQADGSYWLLKSSVLGDEGEAEKDGWFVIKVSSKAYGSREIRYEAADTHEIEVRFTAPALVTLTVDNFNEHPMRDNLRWHLVNYTEGGSRMSMFRQPGDGSSYVSPFTLGPETPGEYFLVLQYSDNNHSSRELLRQPVTLAAGQNSLTASVPALYTLTITADDETTLRRIEVRSADGTVRVRSHQMSPRDGKLTVTCLPPGTYRLIGETGEMEVSVQSDTGVKFESRPYDCFVLTVPSGGDIEKLGLSDEDKLIKCDGAEIAMTEAGQMVLYMSLSKESTTWTVLRGGIETDVTFNGKTMMEIMERRGENRERFDLEPGFRDQ